MQGSPFSSPFDEVTQIRKKLERNFREASLERRRERNKEVNELISNLADPQVAEKLRIYRLVEEQFRTIEDEVTKEVEESMKTKSSTAVNKRPSVARDHEEATKLFRRIDRLKSDIKKDLSTPKESPFDHMLSELNKRAVKKPVKSVKPIAKAPTKQSNSLPPKHSRAPSRPTQVVRPSSTKRFQETKLSRKNQEPVQRTPVRPPATRSVSAPKREIATDDDLILSGSPTPLTPDFVLPRENVAISTVVHDESLRSTKTVQLTAHLLKGINILPDLVIERDLVPIKNVVIDVVREDSPRQTVVHSPVEEMRKKPKVESSEQEEVVEEESRKAAVSIREESPRSATSDSSSSKPSSQIERFSWDKLKESLCDLDPLYKQHVITPRKTKPSSSNDDSNHDSLNGYTLSFDEEAKADSDSAKGTDKSEGKENSRAEEEEKSKSETNVSASGDEGSEPRDFTSIFGERAFSRQLPEEVAQLFSCLSLDSPGSGYSDRLSTIPEDPDSHIKEGCSKSSSTKNSSSATKLPPDDLKEDSLHEKESMPESDWSSACKMGFSISEVPSSVLNSKGSGDTVVVEVEVPKTPPRPLPESRGKLYDTRLSLSEGPLTPTDVTLTSIDDEEESIEETPRNEQLQSIQGPIPILPEPSEIQSRKLHDSTTSEDTVPSNFLSFSSQAPSSTSEESQTIGDKSTEKDISEGQVVFASDPRLLLSEGELSAASIPYDANHSKDKDKSKLKALNISLISSTTGESSVLSEGELK